MEPAKTPKKLSAAPVIFLDEVSREISTNVLEQRVKGKGSWIILVGTD